MREPHQEPDDLVDSEPKPTTQLGDQTGSEGPETLGKELWSLHHRICWGKHSLQHETNIVIQKLYLSATLSEH